MIQLATTFKNKCYTITLRVLSSAPCNDSWGISMSSGYLRSAWPYAAVLVGFWFVWLSVLEYRMWDNPFTARGIIFWTIGFVILWTVCQLHDGWLSLAPAIFLGIVGVLACIVTPFIFPVWIWGFAAQGSNGDFEGQLITFFSAICYLVLPGGAAILGFSDRS